MTAAADAAGAVAHAGTVSNKVLLAIGAVLATTLLAGCGGSREKVYSIGPTEQCLHEKGERAVRNPNDPSVLTLQWAFLRFHPDVKAAKDFDVSTLSTSFGGYQYHRLRRGNVSLVWATGGARRRRAEPGRREDGRALPPGLGRAVAPLVELLAGRDPRGHGNRQERLRL